MVNVSMLLKQHTYVYLNVRKPLPMTEESDIEHVKVLFRFQSNITDEEHVETMWAIVVDKAKGHYQLDSIPFYGPLVNSNDLIFAEFDEQEKMLTYRETVQPSGNSTIQVIVNEGIKIEDVRNELKALGCTSEKANSVFFVLEVPVNLDYKKIKGFLEQKSSDGVFGYAEPCLSAKHWKDLE